MYGRVVEASKLFTNFKFFLYHQNKEGHLDLVARENDGKLDSGNSRSNEAAFSGTLSYDERLWTE